MEPRSASPTPTDPAASEFVRFCYRRRRVGWPELYDEMCAVAARGLFRGMSTDDLGGLGIGFSLFDMPRLAVLANAIVAEEQAKRRPVAVAIRAEEPPVMFGPGASSVAPGPSRADVAVERDALDRRTGVGGTMLDRRPAGDADGAADQGTSTPVTVSLVIVDADVSAHVQAGVVAGAPVAPAVVAGARELGTPSAAAAERQPERSFDVPIRLVRVPAAV